MGYAACGMYQTEQQGRDIEAVAVLWGLVSCDARGRRRGLLFHTSMRGALYSRVASEFLSQARTNDPHASKKEMLVEELAL